jgi:UDP-N-acetylmuramoylalanine--D-glutamate ligase
MIAPLSEMISPKLRHESVSVVGAARSGVAVSLLLAGHGARVFITDRADIPRTTLDLLERHGVKAESGGHSDRALGADLLVVSPGVPTTAPLVMEAMERGIPVRSELEVASWFCEAPIVAVTGSNGKTTTTALVGHVFRTAGRTTWVAGNIGLPFSSVASRAGQDDVVVLEVSSFQLDHTESFRPRVSVLLNITPDHLDRYGHDLEAYAAAKLRIAERQGAGDAVVYNADDPVLRRFAESLDAGSGPTPFGVTLGTPDARSAAWLTEDRLTLRIQDIQEDFMRTEELALRGRHNLYNSLAAAVAARVMEVRSDVVRASLMSFEGIPHRLETVRELDGVKYVNDSKATNVNAVWYALESFREPVLLIAGGRDKGNDYEPLKHVVKDRVRVVLAIGESADRVVRELGPHAGECFRAGTLDDAVQMARTLARAGDVVLLSPACASFDQFDNFEDRGDTFRRLVADL